MKRQSISGGSQMASAPAGGDGDVDMDPASNSGSDSDVDGEAHDFTPDGVLPEALSSLHTVKTASERAAQLTADWHQVNAIIGQADINSRYPKNLHFVHQADAAGENSTTTAMLLIPTDNIGSAGINMASLAESQAFRTGIYTDVPVPTHWIQVSRKLAFQAKRAMAEKACWTQASLHP